MTTSNDILRQHRVQAAPKDIQTMALVTALLSAGYTPETVTTVFDEWKADGSPAIPPMFQPVAVITGLVPPVILGETTVAKAGDDYSAADQYPDIAQHLSNILDASPTRATTPAPNLHPKGRYTFDRDPKTGDIVGATWQDPDTGATPKQRESEALAEGEVKKFLDELSREGVDTDDYGAAADEAYEGGPGFNEDIAY